MNQVALDGLDARLRVIERALGLAPGAINQTVPPLVVQRAPGNTPALVEDEHWRVA